MEKSGVSAKEPMLKVFQMTIAMERVAFQMNSAIFFVRFQDFIQFVQSGVGQVSDFVVLQIEVSKLLQTIQWELDVLELIVSQMKVGKIRKGAEHIIIGNGPVIKTNKA